MRDLTGRPDLDWKAAILEDRAQPLVEHLIELRRRLIVSLLWLGAGTALAYHWAGQFLLFLTRPVGRVYFSAPTEAFYTRMKAALFGGLLLALPLILREAYLFAARAVDPVWRRTLRRMAPLSYLLFLLGASLAVFVVVPAAMRFLLAFGSDEIRPLMGLSAYLEFVTGLALAFGAMFQLPLALFTANRLGLVSRRALAERRGYAYVGAFVLAALLTPGPDVFSQTALALPTVLLYELTLLTLA